MDESTIKFGKKNKKYPNCWNCQHFSITWDPRFPYSCQLLGFKSKITPCIEVIRVDIQDECSYYHYFKKEVAK